MHVRISTSCHFKFDPSPSEVNLLCKYYGASLQVNLKIYLPVIQGIGGLALVFSNTIFQSFSAIDSSTYVLSKLTY